MSQVVIHNQTVYLAGQVAVGTPGGTVAEQTQDVLSKIDALLAEAKTDKTNILLATIWLTDMSSLFRDEHHLGSLVRNLGTPGTSDRCESSPGITRLQY
jgi:enamine deaminase RidA (YjgF/YER057c/UK114 family)